jgi:hypothetical protein
MGGNIRFRVPEFPGHLFLPDNHSVKPNTQATIFPYDQNVRYLFQLNYPYLEMKNKNNSCFFLPVPRDPRMHAV